MITVLFFASYQEITKKKKIILEINKEIKVSEFIKIIIEQFPEMNKYIDNCIISVNQKFSRSNDIIPVNAEVAVFPQVSGGSPNRDICKISKQKIHIQKLIKLFAGFDIGSINIFLGIVRKTSRKNPGMQTKELIYQAYTKMATATMHQICDEIRSKWTFINSIVIVQRIGRLDPGDIAAFIGCSSQHREDGIFEASRYAIDRLKQIVPVWKKEIGDNGFTWVEGEYHPGDVDC